MPPYVVVFSPQAADDLAAIRDHLSQVAGPDFANAFVRRIIDHCEGFAQTPHRGSLRDEVRPGLRIVGWRRAITICFAVDDAARRVDIAGVFYRGRDVVGAMRERP
ncbi:MAG: type II toxin-antitoxin system RelE/ParE family toxin [Alphaproteobacteria bacterium]|nr:type II toxin-antitoxin system RelE/ParE family toxin [Alphaproteobacteria bacterium]